MQELIVTLTIWALPVLFAITLHEAAHGYAARYFGDNTAERAGRLSFNPIHHIDPVGTLLVPGLILAIGAISGMGGMLFGWAKPVPVNFAALRRPKQDMLWVAIAGPASNLAMALGWGLLNKLAWLTPGSYFAEPLMGMAEWGIKINIILMVLNLLPLPPLDGGRVAVSLLPHRQAWQLSKIEPYGMFVLIFMAVTPVLGWILLPLVRLMYQLLSVLLGI